MTADKESFDSHRVHIFHHRRAVPEKSSPAFLRAGCTETDF